MATLKKKNRLGTPPKKTDTYDNLSVPEISSTQPTTKVDGRALRKTGNVQFNTKVSKKYLEQVRAIAKKEGRTLGMVLELSLDAYLKNKDIG